jgi:hypothetical protein
MTVPRLIAEYTVVSSTRCARGLLSGLWGCDGGLAPLVAHVVSFPAELPSPLRV